MGSKRWTEEVLRKINKDAETLTMKQLASKYGSTYSTMNTICKRSLIKPLSEKPRWPKEVKAFILDNCHLSCRELSAQTGKRQDSIRNLLNEVYGPRWRLYMKSNLSKENSK